jgi:hypothetical protein
VIEFSEKNQNRSAKVLLYSFEDPGGEWELEGDDWYRWALPVYRKPQGSWAETTGFTRQKIWFIEKVFSEAPVNPNDIDFPPWFQCYWDSQAGRWVIISPGGGASGDYIIFSFVEDESSSSGSGAESASESSSSSDDDLLPEACEDRVPAAGPFLATVSRRGCGMDSVPGEDKNGFIEVHDLLGILDNRDIRDIIGREGLAVRMDGGTRDAMQSGSVSESDDGCIWVVVIVNFWRVVSVVTDFIFDGKDFTIKRKNITVWDDCALPDEILEGIVCEESSSSESASDSGDGGEGGGGGGGDPDPSPEPPLPPEP